MAGSGNLQVLRLCRLIRTRVTLPEAYRDNTSHSLYTAANTVMGMLVLGRGRFKLLFFVPELFFRLKVL